MSKNCDISLFPKTLGRFWRNFTSWCILARLTLIAIQKFRFLEIQDGGRPPFWKLLNAISPQPFDQFRWNLVSSCTLAHTTWLAMKNWNLKIQDGGRPPSCQSNNRYISTTVGRFWRSFSWYAHFGLWSLTVLQKIWIKLYSNTTSGKVNHGRQPVS